ncbi:MAG TPA: hypothetical protein VGP62_23890 [Bryobacteraceae bacterium]|nr:hypothetical protein [Bryobacteraceae bacterium]
MTRQRWFIALRSIVIGWVTLGLLVFLLEHTLLSWIAPVVGAQWIATAELGLDCAAMAGTGWVVGRLARPSTILGVLVFAVTLTVWDLSFLIAINVPWLLRLVVHAASGDSGYLDSLVTTATTQVLLFGSLVGGGLLSRDRVKPVSIVGDV